MSRTHPTFLSALISLLLAAPVASQPQPSPPPAPAPNAVVVSQPKAAAWLNSAGIPARSIGEADLPSALKDATLVVLPLQQVRRIETVAALKAYVGGGGRVLASYWGAPGVKTPVAGPMGDLLAINVTGWSGKGNNYIAATDAGKPLFNGTGRLYLGRGYAVMATVVVPPAPKPGPKPNSGGPTPPSALGNTPSSPPKPNSAGQTTPPTADAASPVSAAPPALPLPPPVAAGRWVKQDGRPLRDRDTAVVLTPTTLWIGEDIFAEANDTPEVRRWFANAAVTIAPALRLPAKQALLTAAQSRLDLARAAITLARSQGVDAPFNDAQTSLDAATASLADTARQMDFTAVLKSLETFNTALNDALAQSTPSRTVEARAVWIAQSDIAKSREDIRRLVARLADAKFNVVLPETVYRGRAAFPSSVYRQDSRFAGFDPLRALIDEAHKRGMEVHPLVWTLCGGFGGEQGPILKSNPEWAALDKAGRTMTESNHSFWLSPASEGARTAIRNVIREIAAKYDIDGIQLDNAEYPNPWFDYSDDALATYKAATGTDALGLSSISPEYVKWHQWREDRLSSLVHEIRTDLASIKPFAKLSAIVRQTPDDARRDHLQDWGFWLKNRWLDWVAPMMYTTDSPTLGRWLGQDASAAFGYANLVPALGAAGLQDPADLAPQIATTRAIPTQGLGLFAVAQLNDAMLRTLRLGAFRAYAATPWKDPHTAAVSVAASAARMFGDLAAPDGAAEPARSASAAVTLWSSGTLDKLAASTPSEISQKPLDDPRYAEPRALVENARRIAGAGLRVLPEPGLKPTAPPIVTVPAPLPLPDLKVPRINSAIIVDGKLDEGAWQTAETAALGRTTDGSHAKVGATVKVFHDGSTLYIGFSCPEPAMADLSATVTDRDGRVYDDDSVEVFLAPNAIGMPYYHFVVGAAGGVWDDRSGGKAWNEKWASGVSREAASWTAEIAIPFSSLNAAPAGNWRANFTRNRQPGGPSYVTWSVTYGNYHNPDRYGSLDF